MCVHVGVCMYCMYVGMYVRGGLDRSVRRSVGTSIDVRVRHRPTPNSPSTHPHPHKTNKSMWMHSDRGRSTVWPPKLQCTLVLEDVSLYDHGFVFLSKR